MSVASIPYIQAEVLRAVRERLTPLAVATVVAKDEEVGHVIVVETKEAVEARSTTMAKENETRDVIYKKEKEKIQAQVSGRK